VTPLLRSCFFKYRFLPTLVLVSFLLSSKFSSAATVTNISAYSKNGQVFCTWSNLNFKGVLYNLYKSDSPIQFGSQLADCQYLGFVTDSSSLNKRYSEVIHQHVYLKLDSLAAPLDSLIGLFVATSEQMGGFYYAVTTVVNGIEDTAIVPGKNSLIDPVAENIGKPLPIFQYVEMPGGFYVEVYVLFTTSTSTLHFPQMTNVGSYPFNFSVLKKGTATLHPLTLRLPGGGGTFLSAISSNVLQNEYRISMDDILPDEAHATWFGFHENYDIYNAKVNSPPTTGINRDYYLERMNYALDWAIHSLPVDSNSVYCSGGSAGASGSFFEAIMNHNRIAAAAITVPKFDLSFLNDPDTTNLYNTGKDGRLKADTLLGLVSTNLPTNLGPLTYELLNGGWLAHAFADDNLPLLFAVNGKKDTITGWAEKIGYYDSVNANRLGGYYYWDMRKHSNVNSEWLFSPNLFRYHLNLSFPAFSNCSANHDYGDGHANSGDSVGAINGFLDWGDDITDDTGHYELKVFMNDLSTISYTFTAPDSCTTDITLRRLQNFSVPINALIQWHVEHQAEVVQQDSFIYKGGLITLPTVKIYKDTSVIKVTFSIPTYASQPPPSSTEFFVYPNPATEQIILDGLASDFSSHSIIVTDLTGKEWLRFNPAQNKLQQTIGLNEFPAGVYFVKVGAMVKAFVKE